MDHNQHVCARQRAHPYRWEGVYEYACTCADPIGSKLNDKLVIEYPANGAHMHAVVVDGQFDSPQAALAAAWAARNAFLFPADSSAG